MSSLPVSTPSVSVPPVSELQPISIQNELRINVCVRNCSIGLANALLSTASRLRSISQTQRAFLPLAGALVALLETPEASANLTRLQQPFQSDFRKALRIFVCCFLVAGLSLFLSLSSHQSLPRFQRRPALLNL